MVFAYRFDNGHILLPDTLNPIGHQPLRSLIDPFFELQVPDL